MIFRQAHAVLQRILAPVPLDTFLDEILGRRFIRIAGGPDSYRRTLLGIDPEPAILAAFRDLPPNLGFHAAEPKGPPPAVEPVSDSTAFKAKIENFHALGYTVRVPQPRWIAPGLDEILRALEFFFHQPATAEVFWSRGDARAPAHHDDYDLIAIQIKGRKRWFISTDPSDLPNPWRSGPTPRPTLAHHEAVEVGPGDLLYLPRGTHHRVDALADSLHLSIGFVPLTLREAICAMVDHLSDFDRTLREPVGHRLAFAVRSNDFADIQPRIRAGIARLAQVCASDSFIAQAMQRRSSRAISELKKSPTSQHRPAISAETRVRHGASALAHLAAGPEHLDFSHPGEHAYLHRGAEQAAVFIAETAEFKVRDLPGEIDDDVRIALVEKLLTSGFLEVVPE